MPKNLGDVYLEREHTEWYWRALGTLSASLVLLGFLVYPTSFATGDQVSPSQGGLSVAAVVLLALGYALSVALWFLCPSWLFQFDVLFVPCLSSCVLGAVNIALNLALRAAPPTSVWSPGSVSALVLAGASSLIYALLCVATHVKIRRARLRGGPSTDRMRTPSPDRAQLVDGEDLQRKAWARLLASAPRDTTSGPAHTGSTYHIDIPDKARLGNKGSPDPAFEKRSPSFGSPYSSMAPTPSISTRRSSGAGLDMHAPPLPPLPSPPPTNQLSSTAATLQQARERTLQRQRSESYRSIVSAHSAQGRLHSPGTSGDGAYVSPGGSGGRPLGYAEHRASGSTSYATTPSQPTEVEARMAQPRGTIYDDILSPLLPP